jgi:hypothetical protein
MYVVEIRDYYLGNGAGHILKRGTHKRSMKRASEMAIADKGTVVGNIDGTPILLDTRFYKNGKRIKYGFEMPLEPPRVRNSIWR